MEEAKRGSIAYLYKEYCEDDAYGEEYTEIFGSRDRAVSCLKDRVTKCYGMVWEELVNMSDGEDDIVEEDYVSLADDNDAVTYFIVEEKTVI